MTAIIGLIWRNVTLAMYIHTLLYRFLSIIYNKFTANPQQTKPMEFIKPSRHCRYLGHSKNLFYIQVYFTISGRRKIKINNHTISNKKAA